jgi:hypothetical protein
MAAKVKILFLAANPFAYTRPLRLDDEFREVAQAIRRGRERDGLQLVSEHAVRSSELQDLLSYHCPQVVHFAGHGQGANGICLGDEHGEPRNVSGDLLADLFTIVKPAVRVVVLSACEGLPAMEALHPVIDYVIGTSVPVEDQEAILFSSAFYGALANGQTVRAAFEMGQNRLKTEAAGAPLPTLLVRDGVDEGRTLQPSPARPGTPGTGRGSRYTTVIGSLEGERLIVRDDPEAGTGEDVHVRRIHTAKVRETLLETRGEHRRGSSTPGRP